MLDVRHTVGVLYKHLLTYNHTYRTALSLPRGTPPTGGALGPNRKSPGGRTCNDSAETFNLFFFHEILVLNDDSCCVCMITKQIHFGYWLKVVFWFVVCFARLLYNNHKKCSSFADTGSKRIASYTIIEKGELVLRSKSNLLSDSLRTLQLSLYVLYSCMK